MLLKFTRKHFPREASKRQVFPRRFVCRFPEEHPIRNTNGSHTNWPEYCHLAVCLNALKITHSILEYCHKLTKHWKVKNTVIRRKQTTFCFRNSKYVAKLEMSSNWVFRTTLCPIFCLILEFEQFKASAHYD